MANWQFTLELGDVYHEGKEIHELAGIVAERVKALVAEVRSRRALTLIPKDTYEEMADELENNILPMFEEVRDDASMDVEDFDSAMEDLYDWADTSLDGKWGGKKMCWVNTFAPMKKEE